MVNEGRGDEHTFVTAQNPIPRMRLSVAMIVSIVHYFLWTVSDGAGVHASSGAYGKGDSALRSRVGRCRDHPGTALRDHRSHGRLADPSARQ